VSSSLQVGATVKRGSRDALSPRSDSNSLRTEDALRWLRTHRDFLKYAQKVVSHFELGGKSWKTGGKNGFEAL